MKRVTKEEREAVEVLTGARWLATLHNRFSGPLKVGGKLRPDWLPGRLIQSMSAASRDKLKHLTSDMLVNQRIDP